LFLQGILEAGAAPWFDVLPYHAYPTYTGLRVDMDNAAGGRWDALGGYVVGKAGFLRQLLQTYHVSKPLVVNEAGLICSGSAPFSQWCTDEQIGRYYEMQADHLVRSFVRGIGAGVQGFVWYTLEAPGWMRSSLLDTAAEPRQAFAAYQFLNAQLMDALYLGPAVYTDTVESYAFRRAGARVHVLWARQDITVPVAVPQAELADARDRQGNAIALITDGSVCTVPVGFSPVYLTLTP
jgi:pimeloyl-ACP methyl ester carboxylesterase